MESLFTNQVFHLIQPFKNITLKTERWAIIVASSQTKLRISFLSRIDELTKLAGLQCRGLHSSAGRALQRERRGHVFESR